MSRRRTRRDEIPWDISFKRAQQQLVVAAQRARQEIAEGHAKPRVL